MNAVDTNILFYAHDPRDPAKQAVAEHLIGTLNDGVLLWQVACEYLAASRKLAPLGYRQAAAVADVRDLREAWICELPHWDVLDRPDELAAQHTLSFWDALLVAACILTGVKTLYSEDYGGKSPIEGVEFINPFVAKT